MRDSILYNQLHFCIVYKDPDGSYHSRVVKGYYAGSVFGSYGEARLGVYKEKKYGWICVDPETGAALSRKFHQFRQGAIDDARKRLSQMSPEVYGRIRARIKDAWVKEGLMVRKGFGEYKWQQPEI